jgi:CheY-like chemotaxis protein
VDTDADERADILFSEEIHVEHPLRLVVIDDDPILRESLTEGLPLLGAGFTVHQAEDGVAGLTRIIEDRPDCVIIDIRMPHLDGYQVVRAIRGDPATEHIPLIILSALAEDQDRLAGVLSGADMYLYKPVTLDTLVKAIHQAVNEGHAERMRRIEAIGKGEIEP